MTRLILVLVLLFVSACVRPIIVCDTPENNKPRVIVAQELDL